MFKSILLIIALGLAFSQNVDVNQLKFPKVLKFNNTDLTLKDSQGTKSKFILEYIESNRSWDTFSNLIAFRNYKEKTPKEILSYHVSVIKKNNPKVNYQVIENSEKPGHYILDFLTGSYDGEHPCYEFNLWYIYPISNNEVVSIQFAIRSYEDLKFDKVIFKSSKEFGSFWINNRMKFITELSNLSQKTLEYVKTNE